MFVGTKFILNASSFIRNPKKKIEVNTSNIADMNKTLKNPSQTK